MRLLVVGADAAGMSAAHQARRTARRAGRDLEVVACESGQFTSYSQCGIPYWVAGEVSGRDALIARTPDDHRAAGIDLRLGHEVTGLDLAAGRAEAYDALNSQVVEIGFDEVLLATGAAPIIPDWALADGQTRPGVLTLKTLDDGHLLREVIERQPASAAIVGGGYIGVEAAEALARRGVPTTLLSRRRPLAAMTVPEQSERVVAGLEELGVQVRTHCEVIGLESAGQGHVLVDAQDNRISAELVVLALGVQPRTGLAVEAGLPVASKADFLARGALVPDDRQHLADGVWAAGDCCAVYHRLAEQPAYLPLGTHANKAGRVAGTNIGGGLARFPGAVGTAITRAGRVEVSRTGMQPEWVEHLGGTPITATLDATTTSGYMPESEPMHLWAMGDEQTGRLLGCQITGGTGAGKRIDAVAVALMAGWSCEEFAMADLSYAPPFSPAWEPTQIVVRKLAERVGR
ncbi:MAG: FAD-dependent oxidoreductase [Actinomycetales bacterium]